MVLGSVRIYSNQVENGLKRATNLNKKLSTLGRTKSPGELFKTTDSLSLSQTIKSDSLIWEPNSILFLKVLQVSNNMQPRLRTTNLTLNSDLVKWREHKYFYPWHILGQELFTKNCWIHIYICFNMKSLKIRHFCLSFLWIANSHSVPS